MDFKVAYTSDESKIQPSLQSGIIDSGDMVLVSDDTDEYGNLVIINDKNKQIKISTNVRKFDNMQLANAWLSDKKSPNVGEVVSVKTDDKYILYTINKVNESYVLETSTPTNIDWINI